MACRYKVGNVVTLIVQKPSLSGPVNIGTKGTIYQCIIHRSAYYISFPNISKPIWVYDSEIE